MLKQFLLIIAIGVICACHEDRELEPGFKAGQFTPCPPHSDCVVSFYKESDPHFMKPWHYSVERVRVGQKSLEIMQNVEGCEVAEQRDDYLQFKWPAPWGRGETVVELYFPESAPGTLYFRSESNYDFLGLNLSHRRMEVMRRLLLRQGVIGE